MKGHLPPSHQTNLRYALACSSDTKAIQKVQTLYTNPTVQNQDHIDGAIAFLQGRITGQRSASRYDITQNTTCSVSSSMQRQRSTALINALRKLKHANSKILEREMSMSSDSSSVSSPKRRISIREETVIEQLSRLFYDTMDLLPESALPRDAYQEELNDQIVIEWPNGTSGVFRSDSFTMGTDHIDMLKSQTTNEKAHAISDMIVCACSAA